jgi:hypothetical protein
MGFVFTSLAILPNVHTASTSVDKLLHTVCTACTGAHTLLALVSLWHAVACLAMHTLQGPNSSAEVDDIIALIVALRVELNQTVSLCATFTSVALHALNALSWQRAHTPSLEFDARWHIRMQDTPTVFKHPKLINSRTR